MLRSIEIQNWTTEVSQGRYREGEEQGLKQTKKKESIEIWNINKIFIITPTIFQALRLKIDNLLGVIAQEIQHTF